MQTIQFDLPEELKLQIRDIQKEIKEIKTNFQPKEPTEFLTRNQVAKLLSVNLSTIHNYCKRSVLQPYGIGSRVYFKRSEVEKALVKLKN
jgi:predicted DNA-binding transcriptional regulator AlpA